MPKPNKPDDKLPTDEAERARDAALRNMLKTPPKLHKNEPRRAVTRKPRD
jgi:hypothetical protein